MVPFTIRTRSIVPESSLLTQSSMPNPHPCKGVKLACSWEPKIFPVREAASAVSSTKRHHMPLAAKGAPVSVVVPVITKVIGVFLADEVVLTKLDLSSIIPQEGSDAEV